ncbi:MAG: SMC-Scp complex subunit ScpB [Acidobacteria bacterium]|nr:SMC-Scp complex subunit ScpB [Acidobacteriota bacterium]MXZ70291.1 SMC-Scp complex subunit ScpB [Acidobacteriota bacterium]MYJ03568.1 SMC-Scp complex subunit ScpB [Acidobacteriota bacterium]
MGDEPSRGDLQAIIEALIFASPDPVTLKTLQRTLDAEPKEDVVVALAALVERWRDRPGGLELIEVAGGYQIVTRSDLHDWVRRLFHEHSRQRLSVPALETLAVVAYRQPVTGPEIAEIRGVNTSGVLGTLVERRLIKVVGRKAVVGRPFLYATTREFLDRFGLKDLSDLPKVEDMAEALGMDAPSALAAEAPRDELLPFDTEGDSVSAIHGEPVGKVH